MKFIHITDMHLVTPGERLSTLDPQARFAACINSINESHADAQCCVITGDLTHFSNDEAYELLASELKRCQLNCYLLVGNHDNREVLNRHFADLERDQNGFVQYTVATDAGTFVMLDTLKLGSPSGEYCQARQQWLRETLARHADEPVFLFMHHPPFDTQFGAIDRLGLIEKQAVEEILAPHRNIRHLFFGHAHRPISGSWRGISFSSLRGTNHQIKLDFDSPQVQYIDEPPEYSVVFVGDEQIVVHTHAYPL